MATFQCRPFDRPADRKPLRRRFRVDLTPPGSGPVTGGVTVLASTKREALAAIRGLLDAHSATMTRSDETGAILDLALMSATVSLRDVYEVASGPSLSAFADKTRGVRVLEESVIIDLAHDQWIRVSRAGTSGTVESTLAGDADEDTGHEDTEGSDRDGDDATGNEDRDHPGEDEARLAREDDIRFRAAVDVLESLVLAQYCAGIDVTTDQYATALATSWDAILNRYT